MIPDNDIPIEGAVKWLLKDRDKYKAKLEQLIPYTKSLEAENSSLKEKVDKLEKRNSELSREITLTPPYKELLKRYCSLKKDNKTLFSKLAMQGQSS